MTKNDYLSLTPLMAMQQEKPLFSGASSLPKTIEYAKRNRRLLHSRLVGQPEHWRFDDRIVAMLVPNLVPEITAFYEHNGPDMVEIFLPHQLSSIDDSLVAILRDIVFAFRPSE